MPYASTLFEAGELLQADQILAEHLVAAREASMPDHMICAYVLRSRIAHARDDIVEALRFLCELEHEGLQRHLPRVAACANLERSRLLVLLGRHDAAEQALARAEELFDWRSADRLMLPVHEAYDPVIARIRLQLARDEITKASRLIATESALPSTHRPRRMKLDILGAIAAWKKGETKQACESVRLLLRLCTEEGYFRIVVDEGLGVLPILQRLLVEVANGPRGARDPILQELIERMLGALGLPPSGAELQEKLESALTHKEFDILQALTEGRSNQDISEQFGISDSTVRTHLRSINLKLGAHSRSQAVAAGRRLMLLR